MGWMFDNAGRLAGRLIAWLQKPTNHRERYVKHGKLPHHYRVLAM